MLYIKYICMLYICYIYIHTHTYMYIYNFIYNIRMYFFDFPGGSEGRVCLQHGRPRFDP